VLFVIENVVNRPYDKNTALVQIQLDAEKIVSGIIAALIIQLVKDAVPSIKQLFARLGRGLWQAAINPLAWLNQGSSLILIHLSLRPQFSPHGFLKNSKL
jgi:hypothetical protein